MENENLNEENSKKSRKIGIIAISIVIIIIAVILFLIFGTRSAKATVEQFIEALVDGDGKKAISLMDQPAATAITNLMLDQMGDDYENFEFDSIDFENFDSYYKEAKAEMDDMSKEEREEFTEKSIENFESIGFENIEITKIKAEKYKNFKKLTEVEVTLEFEGEKQKITFYTMKKGTKEYIVATDASIYSLKMQKQLEKYQKQLEEFNDLYGQYSSNY